MTTSHDPADAETQLLWVDGAAVVAVRGEVDLLRRDEIHRTLKDAAKAAGPLLVDLCECSFMDSTGLDAVLTAERAACKRDVAFAVACRPAGQPRALLELVLDGVLAMHDDRHRATAALRAAR